MVIGHYDAEKELTQSLEDHLFNVAIDARNRAKEIGQGDVLFLLGLFHDLGKAKQAFQDKLLKDPTKQVDHSSAGATYLYQKIQVHLGKRGLGKKGWQLFADVVAYVISAHHGMYDLYANDASKHGYNKLRSRLDETSKEASFAQEVIPFALELESQLSQYGYLTLNQLIEAAFSDFEQALEKLSCKDVSEKEFYAGCFVRLYLSFLKNADILDTVNAYEEVIEPATEDSNAQLRQSYLQRVEEVYQQFGQPTNRLNQVRTMIAERIKERGQADTAGIYRLNLPTGAGKTKSSLRYAVHQMAHQDKKRFFYITAFLSVLEQNAADIKQMIGDEGVLEHHSNVVREKECDHESQEELMQEYLLESWDSPVVLTTMVQFFQTLFKTKSANIRRFSSLINSVVVLDEVQSLPIEVTTLFNLTMNFLSSVIKTTVILCTATQPTYDDDSLEHRMVYGGKIAEQADIVTLTQEERAIFERTELRKLEEADEKTSLADVAQFVLSQEESTLVILNTKAAVAKFYGLLAERTERPLYQLSTNMCPKHRLDKIAEMKEQLKEDLPIICVSTQLIEAGGDVDFARVVRSYAGIDSIVQAAGRCNREGKRDKGQVTLVHLTNEEENLSHLTEIKHKKSVTETILRQKTSPIDVAMLNDEFFKRHYANYGDTVDYPIGDNQSGYDCLSHNEFSGPEKGKLRQAFKTAGQAIDLIKDDSIGMIVPYGTSEELLAEFETFLEENPYPDAEGYAYIKKTMKQLQLYTVSVREKSPFLSQAKSYLDGQILILPKEFYDDDFGIKKEADSLLMF
ncbi:CRISPR-associated helicase Cas3' [Streptococcus sp. S784/96/1]|uniref:CRISPR-associated helicase Cas3' n=1 Tax=Streptococcus sp. S784/96/1 TaxID=2653499 RepID=UPI00138956DB|nr:CRISPR-associated helicase Cas3' [Streptococcus sp. S784/96/1]